ncbi:GNAT family N-acetyltransferase [Piscinibacter sp.]|jgi:ribosomal-protein-alanine N-acetyltransferase|uniref:GNAT family N-acetyltransferase n=1 Tax=Piscinibacter sp. TaxID=1903157 RepID=UPI00355A2D45
MHLLTTSRLRLEPLVAEHAEEMFRVLSDPAIYEFENQPPASLAWLRERYARLETRCSADGSQRWLNWVLRLHAGEPIGYVQASVLVDGQAFIAYELSSKFWGRGLAHEAVDSVISELVDHHRIRRLLAILKAANHRSRRLLDGLGFHVATAEGIAHEDVAADELLMIRAIRSR